MVEDLEVLSQMDMLIDQMQCSNFIDSYSVAWENCLRVRNLTLAITIYFKSNNNYATTLKQNPINEKSQLGIEIETLLSIRTL